MQTRSDRHEASASSGCYRATPKLGPPGVWDRDPLEDATGASLLIALPDALADDELLARAWVGRASRIGAPLVAELDLAGIDPWDNEVRAWLGHVGRWTLARTGGGGAMLHCWIEEYDIRHPQRLVGYLEDLVATVRARIVAYEGASQPESVPSGHAQSYTRLERLWAEYRNSRGMTSRVPTELIELSTRVARHEARRLRPNMPDHSDQADVEARAVLSVFDSIDQAWRAECEQLVPRLRRGVRWVVLDELRGEAQLSQEERALLGIDSLKVSLEDIEFDEDEQPNDSVLRPSEPPASNPRWTPCDHLASNDR